MSPKTAQLLQGRNNVHSFSERLADSHCYDEIFAATYHRLFPVSGIVRIPDGSEHQSRGVDKIVVCHDGSQILIEEKVRRSKYAPDAILLEFWSVKEERKPGWIERPLLCDWIAYFWQQNAEVLMLNWQQLRRAWSLHSKHWIKHYRIPPSRTITRTGGVYTSESVLVPRRLLLDAMARPLTW